MEVRRKLDIKELSDIACESGVIGSLIFHPDFILHSDDYLKPSHFFGTENGCIYWAIQELYKEGITNIDAYNLSNKLRSNKSVSKTIDKYNLPSVQEFIDLYKETARDTIEEYVSLAQTVTTYAFRREMIKSINEIERVIYDKEKSLEELNNYVYNKLDDTTSKFLYSNEIQPIGDQIEGIWDEICSRRTADGLCGIPSKYPTLNQYFTYENGELYVIQARMKNGKSFFIMNEIYHKLQNNVPCVVFDTEMQTRQYIERLLALMTGVDIKRIKNGKYNDEEYDKICKAKEWLKSKSFFHMYCPNTSLNEIYGICKSLKYKYGLGFVAYDYIKSNDKDTGRNYNVLGEMTDFLKNRIAGELDLPVLTAAQLNRANEIADSDKINRSLSVAIKWGFKTPEQVANDGMDCGNMFAKVYLNRLGDWMAEDEEDEYIDFFFQGSVASITEAKQHKICKVFN